MPDWSPEEYLAFDAERARPGLDLMAAVGAVPDGDVIDLGCGPGTLGRPLAERFRGHRLVGVDASPAMLERAGTAGVYDRLERVDIAHWQPDRRPALIFSNAVLHWLPDHGGLLPRLLSEVVPNGVLAVQMPRQHSAPAQTCLRKIAAEMFPDRYDWSGWQPPVAEPEDYAAVLAPLAELSLWETVYYQILRGTPGGHPVRVFGQSTVARPILAELSEAEQAALMARYDAALATLYPARPDGSVLYPFRRLFLTLRKGPG